jgi:Ca2+-binding RTX toxin-like protein
MSTNNQFIDGVDLNGDKSGTSASFYAAPHYYHSNSWSAAGYSRTQPNPFYEAKLGLPGGVQSILVTPLFDETLPGGVTLNWRLGYHNWNQTDGTFQQTQPTFAINQPMPTALTYGANINGTQIQLQVQTKIVQVDDMQVHALEVTAVDAQGSPIIIDNALMQEVLRHHIGLEYTHNVTQPNHRLDLRFEVAIANSPNQWVKANATQAGIVSLNLTDQGPIAQSADFSGNAIVIGFANIGNRLSAEFGHPLAQSFKVKENGQEVPVQSAYIVGDRVFLSLDRALLNQADVQIQYTDLPGDQITQTIQTWHGNDAASFSMAAKHNPSALLGVPNFIDAQNGTGTVLGSSDDDRIVLGDNLRPVQGGDGVDLVVLNGTWDDFFEIQERSNGFAIRRTESDQLVVFDSVEALQFDDSVVAMFNGHFYEVDFNYATWEQAREQAAEDGGYIASITTEAENNFVISLMKTSLTGQLGLGASRSLTDGKWRWENGELMYFSDWGQFQPDNWNGNEQHLTMALGSWLNGPNDLAGWNDTRHFQTPYLIEYGTTQSSNVIFEKGSLIADSRNMTQAGVYEALGGNDTVNGSEGDDHLYGDEGNDVLNGLGGNDLLSGGDGNDQLNGGDGNDMLQGGNGDDTLTGGSGNDRMFGDDGNDTLMGGTGDDSLWGGNGNDLLMGEDGNDYMIGGPGQDTINGGPGIDTISYRDAAGMTLPNTGVNVNLATGIAIDNWGNTDTLISIEQVWGSEFDDVLTGGNPANGTATSTPYDGYEGFQGFAGNDTIDGGPGFDRAIYDRSPGPVEVKLNGPEDGYAKDGFGGTDVLRNIEEVRGSAFNDRLTGSDLGIFESFEGMAGDDTIDGAGGIDRANYSRSPSGVYIDLGAGIARDGWGGNDTLLNIEELRGSEFNDVLIGDDGNNFLDGMGGDDLLLGGLGADTLRGGPGNDTLDGGGQRTFSRIESGQFDIAMYTDATGPVMVDLSVDGLNGTASGAGIGTDVLINIEMVIGSNFNDVIRGSNRNVSELFRGGLGDDTIYGGAINGTDLGNNFVDYRNANGSVQATLINRNGSSTGADGNDVFFGIMGLLGSAFNDVLTGDEHNNFIEGRGGDDTLHGGGGIDTISYGGATGSVTVNLSSGTATGADGNDTFTGFENIRGSNFNDELYGDSQNNVIDGFDGDDMIHGNAGDDDLHGGRGADTLFGGSGNDILHGGDDDDWLHGGAGNDTLDGGSGNDIAFYNMPSDGVNGTRGVIVNLTTGIATDNWGNTDTLRNIEHVVGSHLNDLIQGDDGYNSLFGLSGDDTLIGGGNAGDHFQGGAGKDSLVGGSGDDWMHGGSGNDTMLGNGGNDTVAYSLVQWDDALGLGTQGVTVNLLLGTATDNWGDTDTLIDISNVIGSEMDDTITGNHGNNHLMGNEGNDTLTPLGGNDTLDGGDGQDSAVFRGNYANYHISLDFLNGTVTVNDQIPDRDGVNQLSNVEVLVFADRTVSAPVFSELTGKAYQWVAATAIAPPTALTQASSLKLNGISGYLANINNEVENQVIFGLINQSTLKVPQFPDPSGLFVFGASDVTTEGTWRWLDGPEKDQTLTYLNWDARSGEPNNSQSNEDYIAINTDQGKWVDLLSTSYSNTIGYLVEFDMPSQKQFVKVNPAATYLADTRTGSTDITAPAATQVLLSTLGLQPGDVMGIAKQGDYQPGNSFADNRTDMLAVFMDANGLPVSPSVFRGFTSQTQSSGLNTNIDADFSVASGYTRVQIPANAVSIAFTANDIFYSDNTDPDNDYGAWVGAIAHFENSGSDLLFGTTGNDLLLGGAGDDVVFGGIGNDTLVGGHQTRLPWLYTGGADYDRLDYTQSAGVEINLTDRTLKIAGQQSVSQFSGFEEINGGWGRSDTITGQTNLGVADVKQGGNAIYLMLNGGSDTVNMTPYGYQQPWADGALVGYHWSQTGIQLKYVGNTATVTYGASGNQIAGVDTLTHVGIIGDTRHDDVFDLRDATLNHMGYITNPYDDASWHALLLGRGGNDKVIGNGLTSIHFGAVTHTSQGNKGLAIDLMENQANLSHLSTNGTALGTLSYEGVRSVTGTRFDDTMLGGVNDAFESFRGDGGNDYIDGRTGWDRVDYRWSNTPIHVDLGQGVVTSVANGKDTLRSIESVRGSMLNDVFDATSFMVGQGSTANIGSIHWGLNEFEGMGGDDVIHGNGNTRISYYGSMLAVEVNLGLGFADARIAQERNTDAYLTLGRDTFTGVSSVHGSVFDDLLIGGGAGRRGILDGIEQFIGGPGNDTINGAGGEDLAVYNSSPGPISVNMNLATEQVQNDGWGYKDTLIDIQGIVGTAYDDTVSGGPDKDAYLLFSPGKGRDIFFGGAGINEIDYTNSPQGVVVRLGGWVGTSGQLPDGFTGSALDGWGDIDLFTNVQNVEGSFFDDLIVGDSGNNLLDGRGGNDTIDGGDGIDTIEFNQATQGIHVDLGRGLVLNDGQSQVRDPLAPLAQTLVRNIENVNGSSHDDLIIGDSNNNELQGLRGNDTLMGGEGIDTAVFRGTRDEYRITTLSDGSTRVLDLVADRDGTDLLSGIEWLRFSDVELELNPVKERSIKFDLTFSAESGPGPNYANRGTAILDINGDLNNDLVMINANEGTTNPSPKLTTFINNPSSLEFTLGQNFTIGKDSRSIASGDFNGDGFRDLAVGALDGQIYLFHGSATSGFIAKTPISGLSSVNSITVGDINKDGLDDIVFSAPDPDRSVGILISNGNGFAAPQYIQLAGSPTVSLADVNNDGHLDILAADWKEQSGLHIYHGSASGAFSLAQTIVTDQKGGWNPIAFNYNDDQYLDIAVANYYSNSVTIFASNAQGNYQVGQTISNAISNPTTVIAADLDANGIQDLVVAGNSGFSVYAGSQGGIFNPSFKTNSEYGRYDISVSQLEGDQLPDVMLLKSGGTGKNNEVFTYTNTTDNEINATNNQIKGTVYHWKSHQVISGVEVALMDGHASSSSNDLFDLREAHYDTASNSLSVQLWANPTRSIGSVQFTAASSDATAARFVSELPDGWTPLFNANNPQLAKFGALNTNVNSTNSQPLFIGTLEIDLSPQSDVGSLRLQNIEVGNTRVPSLGFTWDTQKTNSDGEFLFTDLATGSYALSGSKSVTNADMEAITAADASAALMLAVGLNPNDPDGPGPMIPVSPYQFIAADVNQSGTVTSADALGILRMSVGFEGAPPSDWVFLAETIDFWNETANNGAGGFNVNRRDIDWDPSILVNVPPGATANMVGVLMGDVNGNWFGPESAPVMPRSHFDNLVQVVGTSAAQWGIDPLLP